MLFSFYPIKIAVFQAARQFFRALPVPSSLPVWRLFAQKAPARTVGATQLAQASWCSTLVAAIWAMMRPHRVTESTHGAVSCWR